MRIEVKEKEQKTIVFCLMGECGLDGYKEYKRVILRFRVIQDRSVVPVFF